MSRALQFKLLVWVLSLTGLAGVVTGASRETGDPGLDLGICLIMPLDELRSHSREAGDMHILINQARMDRDEDQAEQGLWKAKWLSHCCGSNDDSQNNTEKTRTGSPGRQAGALASGVLCPPPAGSGFPCFRGKLPQ